jgi:TonB family protein
MNFPVTVIARTTIVLFIAALASPLLHRASASTRHAVWALAIVGVLLLPLIAMFAPPIALPLLPHTSTTVRLLPILNTVGATYEPLGVHQPPLQFQVEAVWLTGVAVLLTRFLAGMIAVRRFAKSGRYQRTQEGARLLFVDAPISPMTYGVLRHTILLPAEAGGWSEERRQLVLAHELAHVKRNDGLVQLLTQIACSIYWFNPMVWYATHRIRIERERSCDDRVLGLGATAEDYAEHLVQIVRGLRDTHRLSFSAMSMAQPSQLETRLVSILNSRTRRKTLSKFSAALLCAAMASLTVLVGVIGVAAAVPLPPVLAWTLAPPTAIAPATATQRTRIGDGTPTANPIKPPQVIDSFPPSYTPEALRMGVEGTVTVEATVDAEGHIKGSRIVHGLGYGLDEIALVTVQDWKFAPALRDGIPVEAVMQIDVDFSLENHGAFRVGRGVTAPTVISRVEPQYTDEARAERLMGTVVVSATIQKDGSLKVERVLRGLDHGLTERAVEALEQWKFKPGTNDGEPVVVRLNIEVNFNLK